MDKSGPPINTSQGLFVYNKTYGNLMWPEVDSTSLENAPRHERVVVDSEQSPGLSTLPLSNTSG